MREPRKFPKVLTWVMVFLTSKSSMLATEYRTETFLLDSVLFGGSGALSYLTFGSEIKTVVIVNFDSESRLVQAVMACSAYIANPR
jgi:proton-coupled amino acid transporter